MSFALEAELLQPVPCSCRSRRLPITVRSRPRAAGCQPPSRSMIDSRGRGPRGCLFTWSACVHRLDLGCSRPAPGGLEGLDHLPGGGRRASADQANARRTSCLLRMVRAVPCRHWATTRPLPKILHAPAPPPPRPTADAEAQGRGSSAGPPSPRRERSLIGTSMPILFGPGSGRPGPSLMAATHPGRPWAPGPGSPHCRAARSARGTGETSAAQVAGWSASSRRAEEAHAVGHADLRGQGGELGLERAGAGDPQIGARQLGPGRRIEMSCALEACSRPMATQQRAPRPGVSCRARSTGRAPRRALREVGDVADPWQAGPAAPARIQRSMSRVLATR